VLPRLVRGPTCVGSGVRNGLVIDPVQEISNFSAAEPLNRNAAAPLTPLAERRPISIRRSLGWPVGSEVLGHGGSERGWYGRAPVSPALAPCPILPTGELC
jgi:hypothetical protein